VQDTSPVTVGAAANKLDPNQGKTHGDTCQLIMALWYYTENTWACTEDA